MLDAITIMSAINNVKQMFSVVSVCLISRGVICIKEGEGDLHEV